MAAKRGWQKKSSAADDAKALLDSLMGPKRDEAPQADGIREGFLEKNVCRRYLCGLCPNDWFKSTKREMDTCGKIHSDQLIAELKAHPETERYTAEFEHELLVFLEDVCADADRWVARERRNLRPPGTELQLSVGHQKSLREKQERHRELIEEATRLGEEGEVHKSAQVTQEAIKIKEDMEEILAKFTVETGGEDVCEACGVRYPLGNTPNEVGNRESHFSGKMHEAYTTIRKKVEELREKKKSGEWDKATAKKSEGKDKEKEKEKDRDGKDGKDGGRSRRSRSRDRRSRDRGRNGDRDRDRDRDRSRRRSRSRGRRDRSRERSRSRRRR